MCGIAGMVGPGARAELEAIGSRMAAALRHRGPDAWGLHVLPRDRGVFAHTRLKVIDPSDRAAQPFVSEDGAVTLVLNGEIYDFRELRRELEVRGARFRSDSDTEVVLRQYLAHGVRGLEALDGMFALAIWDARDETLLLARDRMGKKPLAYATARGGAFLFGSEIKALAAHGGLDLEVEIAHLPELLALGYAATPRSLYRGVAKLPPASRLRLRAGAPAVERTWRLEAAPSAIGAREARERVRSAVRRAVARRLVSDVPIGAFLSGGLDSSVIAFEMTALGGGRVRTFAAGFDDDATYDETPHARRVAAALGTDHREVRVRASPDLLETHLEHHDEPHGDSSALALLALAAETRREVSVVLTGDGGDELFAGYTRFLGALALERVPPRVGAAVRAVTERLALPWTYKHPLALLGRFVEHADRAPDEQLLAWNTLFAGPRLGALLRPDVFGRLDPWSVLAEGRAILERERGRGRDRLAQLLRHNLETYLLDDLLVKLDRATMAVGLEARSPFLDTALVELAFSLPSSLKVRFGRTKWILREAYAELLPRGVAARRKHGFGVPVGRWWCGPARALVGDLLLCAPRLASLLDAAAVRRLVEEHWSGRADHGQRIFLLLQLELWLRRGTSASPVRSSSERPSPPGRG